MTYQLIYGINVYNETFHHIDKLGEKHKIPYQLAIGKNLEQDKYDCTLLNYLCIEDYYIPKLKYFLFESFTHFFENNPTEIICFRLDLSHDRNLSKWAKFSRFLNCYKDSFKYSLRILSEKYVEITIKKVT